MTLFIIGAIALRVLVIAFLILLAVRITVGVRARHNGALAILAKRFATGEISEEQFRRMRGALESDR